MHRIRLRDPEEEIRKLGVGVVFGAISASLKEAKDAN